MQEAFNQIMVGSSSSFEGYIVFVKTSSTTSLEIPMPHDPENRTLTIATADPNDGSEIGTACYTQGGDAANGSPQTVACNIALFEGSSADPYFEKTAVHELGHILDYLSGDYLQTRMEYRTASGNSGFVLGGCRTIYFQNRPITVMGVFRDVWRRGSSGWGSNPASLSEFIRNNANTPREAAADMFLNWVYRTNSINAAPRVSEVILDAVEPRPPKNGCIPLNEQITENIPGVPQPWNGFQNIVWGADPSRYAWSLPGDVRQAFMTDILTEMLNNN